MLTLLGPDVVKSQRGWNAMMDLRRTQELADKQCLTLPNFPKLFINSCLQLLNNDNETCQRAWEAFSGAFAYKNATDVTLDSYNEYFELFKIESKPNSVVFWSGVLTLIEEISKTKDYPISSSFTHTASSIINNMEKYPDCWCGGPHGIDYDNPCPDNPSVSFWAKLSCLLGESSNGTSFWIGDGERRGGTFRNESFFTEYEFVKLEPPRNTKLVVLDIDGVSGVGETCGTGSLADLKALADDKFGEKGYTCYDVLGNLSDPNQLMRISNNVLKIIGEEQAMASALQISAVIPLLIFTLKTSLLIDIL
jgi:hypothetical protein